MVIDSILSPTLNCIVTVPRDASTAGGGGFELHPMHTASTAAVVNLNINVTSPDGYRTNEFACGHNTENLAIAPRLEPLHRLVHRFDRAALGHHPDIGRIDLQSIGHIDDFVVVIRRIDDKLQLKII